MQEIEIENSIIFNPRGSKKYGHLPVAQLEVGQSFVTEIPEAPHRAIPNLRSFLQQKGKELNRVFKVKAEGKDYRIWRI